jgi:phospholipid/cholesterol/gamma-HCH transport system ATP-binding protein
MTTPILRIRGLCRAFDGVPVLAGVDLDIAANENLVLLGRSGAGKTVLLKCIIGLVQPDAGSVEISGRETVGLGAEEREALFSHMGVLFQNGALFDSQTVWENVAFTLLNNRGMPHAAARHEALRVLAEVGLDADTAELLPAELSGGMQRRVALARAIAGRPDLLFLDNPTAGLDPIVTVHIDHLIRQVIGSLNAAALTITQDIASALRIGDRIALLAGGRIAWTGPVDEAARSGNADLAAFFKTSGALASTPKG